MNSVLSYDTVGATTPDAASWPTTAAAYRRHESTALLGHGADHWAWASSEVLRWGVKTRSGFTVAAPGGDLRVRRGTDCVLTAHVGPLRVREPVRVVAVCELPDRCGFAYGTVEGHPVSGEEAFVVHRTPDGAVWLTLRSLTRSADGPWRAAYPALLAAQRYYRRRYRQALVEPRS